MRASSAAAMAALFFFVPLAGGADLYVSPFGNEAGDGSSQRPFRTLERGIAALRAARSRNAREPLVLWIVPGTYRVEQSLVLTNQHSGSTLRVLGKGVVRVTGGREVPAEAFRPATNLRLDASARGHVVAVDLKPLGIAEFGEPESVHRAELIFDDAPLPLARWPNDGFAGDLQTAGGEPFVVNGIEGDRSGVLRFGGDRPARWLAEKDLLLHGYWFWDWRESYQRVADIDLVQKLLKLKPPQHRYGYRSGARYYALNALVELDRPGEWYIDRDEGVLYLWPPAPLAGSRLVLSQLDAPLLVMREASHIEVRGLTFEAGRAGAIEISGGEYNVLRDCTVRNIGGDAVVISGGHEHRVEACDIRHIGGAAVVVNGGDRRTLQPGGHSVHGNRIRDFARVTRTYAPAIQLDGVGLSATNNDIAEAPHLAIWFSGNEHRIERNEIHHVVRETDDAGAIYTGRDWTARGTVIRQNYVHDIHGVGAHGAQAIYLDDAASGIIVTENVLQRVDKGILAGGGRDNVLEDNVMLDCRDSLVFDNRGLNWMKASVTPPDGVLVRRLAAMPIGEPPWSERYPRLARLLEDEPGAPKYNVVRENIAYRCKPAEVAPGVVKYGRVSSNEGSEADPGLVEEAGRLRFLPDSLLVRRFPRLANLPLGEIGLPR